MARMIAEIYDRLNQSKDSMQELHDYVVESGTNATLDNAETLLADLNSKSKVAIWRLWLWLMAVGSWIVESLFDVHKSEIEALMNSKRPHTLRWYADESKKFQFGYGLVWIDDIYQYSIDAPESKLIKYAAASESNDTVIVKVAKEVGDVKQPLNSIEVAAFTDYWAKMKDAGVKLQVVSLAADLLKINITIVRDRMVLAGDNSLLRDSSVKPIDNAIAAFGEGLEFDGILRLSKLVDAIQAAEGVIDVKLNSAHHKPAGGSFAEVSMFVVAESGYFILDQDNSVFVYEDEVNVTIIE